MKSLRMILLFLLMILAALSAYYALTPLVYSAQKTRQMKEESQTFYEKTELKHALFFIIGLLTCISILVALQIASVRISEDDDFDDNDE